MIDTSVQQLIINNMALVPYTLEQLHPILPAGMSPEDALQCGYVGLVEAARRFQPGSFRFSTFAVQRIRGAILDGIQSYQWFPLEKDLEANSRVFSVSDWDEQREEIFKDPGSETFEKTMAENATLKKAFMSLSEEERHVLYGYYVKDLSIRGIARQDKVCRNRIYVLKNEAVKKLKKYLEG